MIAAHSLRSCLIRRPMLVIALSFGAQSLLAATVLAQAQKAPTQESQQALCPTITKSINQNISAIGALNKEIEKAEKGGASSLLGMFKELNGQPYTNPGIAQKKLAIERKIRLVNDMNGVLTSMGCKTVDLPPGLKKAS